MTFAQKMGSVIGNNDRLQWGRGSERSAAHTQRKLTQVPPPGDLGLPYEVEHVLY